MFVDFYISITTEIILEALLKSTIKLILLMYLQCLHFIYSLSYDNIYYKN